MNDDVKINGVENLQKVENYDFAIKKINIGLNVK